MDKKIPQTTKVPADFLKALKATPKALPLWKDITPIAQRDFIRWVESAKQEETRARRIKVACSKLLSGQKRPCCYEVVPMSFYKALGDNPKAKAVWKDLTPNERRDFVDWLDKVTEKDAHKIRVQKACATLASGKKRP